MKEREVAVSDQEQIGCIRFLFWGQILRKKWIHGEQHIIP